jgi:hypothetical protein
LLLVLFIVLSDKLSAQDIFSPINKDSSEIRPYRRITLIGDSVQTKSSLFDSIYLTKSKRYNVKNEIRNLIVVPDQRTDIDHTFNSFNYTQSISQFQPFNNKIIRNIHYQQLEVLGQNISDPSEKPDNWFEKLINGLHIKTQTNVIENSILFKPGDQIEPVILADNERLIRRMSNIQDVRIIPQKLGTSNDSVDILVMTKDVMPIGFGVELFDLNKGQTGIWSKNLLGIGQEIYYYLQWDIKNSPIYGHKLRYRINNIVNTFFSADATYENNWQTESFKFYLNREFFTPETKYAGGTGYEKNRILTDIYLNDTLFIDQRVDYKLVDLWIGRSVRFMPRKNMLARRTLAITGRIYNYDYLERPPMVNETNLYSYHSRTTVLLYMGLSSQAFIKSKYLYGFGRPEDIPYGSRINIVGGYEISEFNNRYYAAIQFASGYFFQKFGYLYQNTEYGTFYNNKIEQGTIKLNTKYFTPLLNSHGRYRHRIFTDLSYIRGISRNNDEYVELSTREGVRGLTSQELRGNERIYLNFEYDCYSPHKLFGFRLTYFAFFDAGAISESNNLPASPIYTGFGGGIKIKNENLVFNTIYIRLGYYPRLPDLRTVRYYEFYGRPNYEYPSFENKKPEIVKF